LAQAGRFGPQVVANEAALGILTIFISWCQLPASVVLMLWSKAVHPFAALGTFIWAIHGAVLHDGPSPRQDACRFCTKLCPISCFVGTCGFDFGFTVRKFQATNQCYSCDPSTSVGVSRDGDFLRCTAAESGGKGNPAGGDSVFTVNPNVHAIDVQGPAIAGNAGLNAVKAGEQAKIATAAATNAAIYADKAADAAVAKYREVTSGGSKKGGYSDLSETEIAEQHQMATQIRAEEALRVSETAHVAWKAALGRYNGELEKLRYQQIITEKAEKDLEAAEMTSEKARSAYASSQAEATKAAQSLLAAGGSAANEITAQAAAEELAGAARAAQRRLVIAAKEAKVASDKIAIAAAMEPCVHNAGQAAAMAGAGANVPCKKGCSPCSKAPGPGALIQASGTEASSAVIACCCPESAPRVTQLVAAHPSWRQCSKRNHCPSSS
jgi:hypothetical protein